MIFKQYQQILDGTKTQTRRPVKEGERCLDDGHTVSKHWISRFTHMPTPGSRMLEWTYMYPKWRVGQAYAVQPGRGKKSIGRIRITKIRRERLHKIGPDGLRAEGFPKDILDCWASWLDRWEALWNSLYRKPYRWQDNPEVWVLEFELTEKNDAETH